MRSWRRSGAAARRFLLATTLLVLVATGLAAQHEKIGLVDYYGYGKLTRQQLDGALGLKPGDAYPADFAPHRARLLKLPGVKRVEFDKVCCAQSGSPLLFVGLVLEGARGISWSPRPTGTIRIADTLRHLVDSVDMKVYEAAQAGEMGDSVDEGHSLLTYPPARAKQLLVREYTMAHEDEIRQVLLNSASDQDRAMAAEALQYVADKRTVIANLMLATRDPYDVVRNNAVRSMYAFSVLAQRKPELGIRIPVEQFIFLLHSPVWTDRNKTSMTLWPMTESRDPALLTLLKEQELEPLLEIARWQSEGHAFPGIFIVARIAGMSDAEAFQAFQAGDREKILSRVSSH